MCIICYKPENQQFPQVSTMRTMFQNNPDGAGYMYAFNNKIYIRKGFATFAAFNASLDASRRKTGDTVPYVLHFRISTQAHGRADCTHPFPLSPNMADLRSLKTACSIGIAHNGVISLTSQGYNHSVTYSDTMEFIADYLSLIIKGRKFYLDKDTVKLIDKLCEGKLAILDGSGHCTLIGKGWQKEGNLYYSNDTYKERIYKYTPYTYLYGESDGEWTYTLKDGGLYGYKFMPTKKPTSDPAKECKRYGSYYTCSHCVCCRDCYGGQINGTGEYIDTDEPETDDSDVLNADQTPHELAEEMSEMSLVDLLTLMQKAGIIDDVRANNITVTADQLRSSDPLEYDELYDQLRGIYDCYIADRKADRLPEPTTKTKAKNKRKAKRK